MLACSHLLSTVCLFALLLPVAPTQAQSERDTTAHNRPPAFQKGGWGLQYEATSLDGALSGFRGSLFSGRYHFSSRNALRVGISVNASTGDKEEVNRLRRDTLSVDRLEQRTEWDSRYYAVSAEYVHYVNPADRWYVYMGAGPRGGYNRLRQERTTPDQPGVSSERELVEETTYRIGLAGALGVEWFVHPHVSLSVEYPIAFEYVNSDEKSTSRLVVNGAVEQGRTSTTEINRFEIGGEHVRIGVTFSFGPQ